MLISFIRILHRQDGKLFRLTFVFLKYTGYKIILNRVPLRNFHWKLRSWLSSSGEPDEFTIRLFLLGEIYSSCFYAANETATTFASLKPNVTQHFINLYQRHIRGLCRVFFIGDYPHALLSECKFARLNYCTVSLYTQRQQQQLPLQQLEAKRYPMSFITSLSAPYLRRLTSEIIPMHFLLPYCTLSSHSATATKLAISTA
jgi:hypothetical protein